MVRAASALTAEMIKALVASYPVPDEEEAARTELEESTKKATSTEALQSGAVVAGAGQGGVGAAVWQ